MEIMVLVTLVVSKTCSIIYNVIRKAFVLPCFNDTGYMLMNFLVVDRLYISGLLSLLPGC